MPPTVSPDFFVSSTSVTINALVASSKQRSGSASSRSTSPGTGSGVPAGTCTGPIATVWLTSSIPSSRRKALATAPRATLAAVSRALARSSTGRASSKPYFCIPTRSAWPGRGRVSAAPRPRDFSESSVGSALITSTHFAHSVLPTRIAIGPPMLRPCTTPPESESSSCSNFIREPRP